MKEEFEINSFIYLFYNSLTLIFAELEGRYYGGVLELIPSELTVFLYLIYFKRYFLKDL